jgi:glyoxylase-like metal-dependent hydrolase (beta-lactamase superfamily II)
MASTRLGPTPSPPRVRIGDLELVLLDGGHLWLDGGAMFGIIPKPMWTKSVQTDAANRIPLATNCFYLETGGTRILIETGIGPKSKYTDKEQGFFQFSNHWLPDSLAAAGIDPASIDIVLLTHLHFDHAGGGTSPDGRGGYVPTFSRAKYVVQRGEWRDAVEGHCVMTGTYRKENLEPLEKAGVLSLLDGEAEIAPGLAVRVLPGHTRCQQGVVFSSGGHRAMLPADMLPTSAHIGLRHNMAYDLLPFENMQNKSAILKEAASGNWTLLLGQDPVEAVWRVEEKDSGRFSLSPDTST